ncbi:hypothetical protein AVEN_6404-1 [Araneus ventricosus]|uniref:Uncharacterized protein n=1 Tax=Araneus ventricosus TaxID=182803 RepID=A0A4Y2RES8_ARAVE|nr:hypothetical protein AVEN_6404-1 [Araneus ventricosus]
MVKNFNKHFEKSVDEDSYLMMLVLRKTPLENGYSPAELLMGSKLRTNLPMTKKSLMPKIPVAEDIRRKELKYGVNKKNIMTSIIELKTFKHLNLDKTSGLLTKDSMGG